ncbi:hypothetical protein [Vineibacter terrae]|uniref:hypothetical protein n=1 Tax=Vineibacter terrae TaxID=2586908 RepID=UPI002E2FE3C9|nr:hypothetical protein [Vineibacter terrae]HEX2887944.1 hypothetical protein [Vineibacter terrae]
MSQSTALLLSIMIESAVAAALVGAARWGSAPRAAVAAVLATLATHWAVWWSVLWLTPRLGYGPTVAAVEGAVVAVEAIVYRLIVTRRWPRALAVSLAANAASTGIGLALYGLGLA